MQLALNMIRRLAPLLALAVSAACYRYIPETGGQPRVGGEYRAELSSSGAARLQPLLGRDVSRFDGRVLSLTDSSFLVSVGATVTRADPRPTMWSGEQMNIPRSTVSQLFRKELDRPRTMRAVVIAGAAGLLAGSIWFSISGKASSSGPGPGPPINP